MEQMMYYVQPAWEGMLRIRYWGKLFPERARRVLCPHSTTLRCRYIIGALRGQHPTTIKAFHQKSLLQFLAKKVFI